MESVLRFEMVPLASGVGRPSPGRSEFDHIPEQELRREVPARRSSLIPTKWVGCCLRFGSWPVRLCDLFIVLTNASTARITPFPTSASRLPRPKILL